jgi:protease I
MKRALFLTFTGFKDHELVYPYYRVLGAGFQAHIVADKKDEKNRVYGVHGVNMPVHALFSEFSSKLDWYWDNFDLLIIPGGVDNTEYLRMVPSVQQFVRKWDMAGRVWSIICHAPQVAISAGVARGRRMSGFYCIQDDIINAGAEYSTDKVVVDRNLISSPHYDDMGPWMETTLDVYRKLNDKS